MQFKKTIRILLMIMLLLFLSGFLVPERLKIPVAGATAADWNAKSFWYEPWGRSGVHKGIDIFGDKGQRLNSSSSGLVLFTGTLSLGGNVVLVLGPHWKLHYYAHLDNIVVTRLDIVKAGEQIGTVGDSGNARGKPPHLHYSIASVFPRVWRIDGTTQGWKKAFFLDPGHELTY